MLDTGTENVEHPALPDAMTLPLDELEIVQDVSPGWKKVPVICMCVPMGPFDGTRKIFGPLLTIKVAWAVAPEPELPVTVIKYCPGATFPTVKLPLYEAVGVPEPPVIAQLGLTIRLPPVLVMVHDVITPDVAVNCPQTPTSCPVAAIGRLPGPFRVI